MDDNALDGQSIDLGHLGSVHRYQDQYRTIRKGAYRSDPFVIVHVDRIKLLHTAQEVQVSQQIVGTVNIGKARRLPCLFCLLSA